MKGISGTRCCANADPARSIATANRCLFTASSLRMGITGVMLCDTRMRTRFAFILLSSAVAYPTRAVRAADEAADLARLSLEVQRAEDIRAVKSLQISYAQYVAVRPVEPDGLALRRQRRGDLWRRRISKAAPRSASISSPNGATAARACRPAACTPCSRTLPVLNLSADGETAKGRWHEFSMTGQLGGSARWEQGISENEYVKEGGVWKISRINYYLETAGPYETGWVNAGPDVKLAPVSLHVGRGGHAHPGDSGRHADPRDQGHARSRARRAQPAHPVDERRRQGRQSAERLRLLHRPQDVGRRERSVHR